MIRSQYLTWAALVLLSGLVDAPHALAQATPPASASQPPSEAFALYDRVARTLVSRAGVPAPEAAPTPEIACQRYGQLAELVVRFAFGASLPPGTSLDNPRADTRRQAADLMIGDAQTRLGAMAVGHASAAECAATARAIGANAFSFAQSINGDNVQRNTQALLGPAPAPPKRPPAADLKKQAEAEAARTAKAESARLAQEKAAAEQKAREIADHALSILPPPRPVAAGGRAERLSFNIYLIDTPATHASKDLRACFEPALYQRAAKPIVDLASATLESPEVAPLVDEAAANFLTGLRPVIAARIGFPADRLTIDFGDNGAVRGPSPEAGKLVSSGCQAYLAVEPPKLAYDDHTTVLGLLAENVIESVVIRPALEARIAVQPKLEAALMPPATEAPVLAAAEASAADNPPAGLLGQLQKCAQDIRCQTGFHVAMNACVELAERHGGKTMIARELEVRAQLALLHRSDTDSPAAERDQQLVQANLQLLDDYLGKTLGRLAQERARLRAAAQTEFSTLEIDGLVSAGRDRAEASSTAPIIQCSHGVLEGLAVTWRLPG